MKRVFSRTVLGLSGLVLFAIAGLVIFDPVSFFDSNDISLAPSPSLMSELKAPAGLLLVSGVIVMSGVIVKRMIQTALALNALVFGAYALGRLVSFLMDGQPSDPLIHATAIELVIAVISLLLLIANRDQPLTI